MLKMSMAITESSFLIKPKVLEEAFSVFEHVESPLIFTGSLDFGFGSFSSDVDFWTVYTPQTLSVLEFFGYSIVYRRNSSKDLDVPIDYISDDFNEAVLSYFTKNNEKVLDVLLVKPEHVFRKIICEIAFKMVFNDILNHYEHIDKKGSTFIKKSFYKLYRHKSVRSDLYKCLIKKTFEFEEDKLISILKDNFQSIPYTRRWSEAGNQYKEEINRLLRKWFLSFQDDFGDLYEYIKLDHTTRRGYILDYVTVYECLAAKALSDSLRYF